MSARSASFPRWIQAAAAIMLPPPPFADLKREQAFITEHARRSVAQRRVGIIVAFVTQVAYFGWDLFNARESRAFGNALGQVLVLRFVGAAGILTAIVLSRRKRFEEAGNAEFIISIAIILVFLSLLRMIVILQFPVNYLCYFVGLLLVFLFAFGLFAMRAKTVSIILVTCLVMSVIVLPFATLDPDVRVRFAGQAFQSRDYYRDPHDYLNALSRYYYLSALGYLASFVVIGCAIASELERNARSAFVRESEMAEGNAELVEARRDSESRTAALVATKEKLRELAEQENLTKSKFLADAAHDLSQPLHAVSMLMDSAKYALARDDLVRGRELVAAASRTVQTSRSAFRAVLEISQLESGLVSPTYSNFDVETLLEEVVEPLSLVADNRGVCVRLRKAKSGNSQVRSDRIMLGRVLSNLVSNAIKYSDQSKGSRQTVVVGVVPLSNRIRLDVLDNGVGIPEDKWPEVFKAFVQLENRERNREKGVGLGLSIVSATVALLAEHRLNMRSVAGRWTRFSLEVPRYYGAVPTLSAEVAHNVGDVDLTSLFAWYVEDDQVVREATESLLMELGILVEAASSYEEFTSRIPFVDRKPDIIISDYRLPNDRTAVDVVIRSNEVWEGTIPVLILTGEVTQGASLKSNIPSRRVRVEKKPIGPDVMIDAIKQLCSEPTPEPEAQYPVETLRT